MVAHTHEVLQNAEELRLCRAGLRNDYWAFRETHQTVLLKSFAAQRKQLDETLAELRFLTAHNSRQQQILAELSPALAHEADLLEAALRKEPRSGPGGRFPMDTSPVTPTADRTRLMIDEFENSETLFENRTLAVRRNARTAYDVLMAAAILIFGTLLTAGHLIQREVMKRATVEGGLRRAQEILGVRLEEQRTELRHMVEDLHAQIRAKKAADEELRRLNGELEMRVQSRTAELQEVNKELEAFNYSVSHDLRAPLRHLDGFSRILQEEFGPQLPDEARHYLNRVRSAATNMSSLVEDLLQLSRVGRQLPRCQRTSLSALAEEAKLEVAPEANGRAIDWNFHEMPDVEADPILLRQVFTNLLSNAVKFTRKRQDAAIEVGAKKQNGRVVVFVKDNGAGFDPRYADKLFGVFQRLHRQEEYEGTGIGLATVQRIIHKHGGQVWAESQPGCGATFYFTVPLAGRGARSAPSEIGAMV